MKLHDVAKACQDHSEFSPFFDTNTKFRRAIKKYPTYRETLFAMVLSDGYLFAQVFNSAKDLRNTARAYPQYADALYKMVIDDNELFSNYFIDRRDLVATLASSSSSTRDEIFNYLFANASEFNRLVPNDTSLRFLAEKYPRQASGLIRMVLSHPKQFQRLVNSAHSLRKMASQFSAQASIFKYATPKQAFDSRRCIARVRQAARVLAQAARTKTGPQFFHALPDELLVKVAAFTGDETLSLERREAIAYDALDRPCGNSLR